MKITLSLFLLLIIEVLVEAAKKDQELDLNFLQKDYQLQFERMELVRYNKQVFKDVSLVTFKYNRTTAVVNTTFTFKIDVGRDIETVMQAYKFMSNEYRLFPMRFAANSCKALDANLAGMRGFFNCGNYTGCPNIKNRKYHICNWYPDQTKLPPFIPNGQYKLEMQMLHFSSEMGVINVYVTVFRPIV